MVNHQGDCVPLQESLSLKSVVVCAYEWYPLSPPEVCSINNMVTLSIADMTLQSLS